MARRSILLATAALFGLAFLMTGCQGVLDGESDSAPSLSITGTVALAHSSDDPATATVTIVGRGRSERAGADGDFTIAGLAPETYTVRVSAPGHLSAEQEVAGTDGGEESLGTIDLDPSEYVFVSADTGDDANSGLTDDDPVENLQTGIDIADKRGLTNIEVAGGAYDLGGKPLAVFRALRINGGFDANNWTDPDPTNHETRIMGADNIFEITAVPGILIENVSVVPAASDAGFSRGFSISGSTVFLNNVTFEHTDQSYNEYEALGIFNGSYVEITNSSITGPNTTEHANGFHPMHDSYLRVVNSEVTIGDTAVQEDAHTSSVFGIHLTEDATAELEGTTLTTASSKTSNFGVLLEDGGQLISRNSTIRSGATSEADAASTGIGVFQNAKATVREGSEVHSGAAAEDDSYGIFAVQNASLVVQESTVAAGASNAQSAGIAVRDVATASIIENLLIQGGGTFTEVSDSSDDATLERVADSRSAGIYVGSFDDSSVSESVFIAENQEITGPTVESGRTPEETAGILIERASPRIMRNSVIHGGIARYRSRGISGIGFAGTVTIEGNDNIDGGQAAFPSYTGPSQRSESHGILLISSNAGAGARIEANEINGGAILRAPGTYSDTYGISVNGSMEAFIRFNSIAAGMVDNTGQFGEEGDGRPYYGGPTVISAAADQVMVEANELRGLATIPSGPIGDTSEVTGNTVFLRGIYNSRPGASMIAKNNRFFLYQADGPIHVLEPGPGSSYTATNNTIVAQIGSTDTDGTYGPENIATYAESGVGASIRLTNNLWYFPVEYPTLIDGGDANREEDADPEEFDYNYLVNFTGSITAPSDSESGWEGNAGSDESTQGSTGNPTAEDLFSQPDTDLSDGIAQDADYSLSTDTFSAEDHPAIDTGITAGTRELGLVIMDADGLYRPEQGNSYDIGAYEAEQ